MKLIKVNCPIHGLCFCLLIPLPLPLLLFEMFLDVIGYAGEMSQEIKMPAT